MTLNEYQQCALKTAIYPEQYKVIYPALEIAGEAGEFADKMKKIIRDDNNLLSKEKAYEMAMELGDICWGISAAAHDLGFTLEEICEANIKKLESRQRRGVLGGSGDNR